jgi:hypothetical protein
MAGPRILAQEAIHPNIMGNTVVQPSLASAGCDDESVSEEEGNSTTINDNDWSKDDLNHHLRELLLHHPPGGLLSPPPRSVAIERTPIAPGGVLWTTTTTATTAAGTTATTDDPATAMMIDGVIAKDRTDENDRSPSAAISSHCESPTGGGQPSAPSSLREPLLPSSSSTDGSMSTIPHVETEEEEESVHFLSFQEDVVVTTTTPTPTGEGSTTTRRMMTSKDCCIACYHCCCSRLFRALGFTFLVLLLLFSRSAGPQQDRPEGRTTTTFQPKNQEASSFWSTSCCGGLDRSSEGRHIRGCTTTGHVVVLPEEVVL